MIAYGINEEDEHEQNASESLKYVRGRFQYRYLKDLGERQPCMVGIVETKVMRTL